VIEEENPMNRLPAVAGRFYPSDPRSLTREIQRHVKTAGEKVPALGVVCPHAGFIYSGDVAGAVYSRVEIPDTLVILGPNHHGQGNSVSLMAEGKWSMPLGDVEIDSELARAMIKSNPWIKDDWSAHELEHSLETQIPFIQYFRKDFKIVPICLRRIDAETCDKLGQAIAAAVRQLSRAALIVASSDMTHYESHEEASRKDREAIERLLQRDARGLLETIAERRITMCGVIPAAVMLMACNRLGARDAELVKYMTSGEISGDMDRVVGYAGVIVR
jgi:AmmeMemoRadiSam system protein B